MKKISLLFLTLSVLYFSASGLAYAKNPASSAALITVSDSKSFPGNDYKAETLRKFLKTYNSPLADYAGTFVRQAKAYDIDWRMVAAISGVESTFGEQIPYGSYNAWGWGIYGNQVTYFKSYSEAIKTISKSLRQDYMDKWGAKNVYAIGRIYAASPSWAGRVNYFMNRISEFEQANSIDSLSISL